MPFIFAAGALQRRSVLCAHARVTANQQRARKREPDMLRDDATARALYATRRYAPYECAAFERWRESAARERVECRAAPRDSECSARKIYALRRGAARARCARTMILRYSAPFSLLMLAPSPAYPPTMSYAIILMPPLPCRHFSPCCLMPCAHAPLMPTF